MVQDEQVDTSSFEIGWSWKLDPYLTSLWPLTPEGKVGRRGQHEHFWSMVQNEQFDTSSFEIGWSWKLDPNLTFFDLWPVKERSGEEVTMNTFDLWFKTNILTPQPLKSDKLENLTSYFDPRDPIWPHIFLSPHNFCRECREPSCPQIS